jgi:uncharacterized phiE125 gp8 family phage protein
VYGLTLVTAPTIEPVSLDEAKAHVRIYANDDDAMLSSLISAARQSAERFMNRAILTQTWDFFCDLLPCGNEPLELPMAAPLQSVTSLKYYDADGTQQTWSSSNYVVSVSKEPGTIRLAYGISWPSVRVRPDSITVRYVAGWTSAALVPYPIKQAILLLIGHWYNNREEVVAGTMNKLESAAEHLLTQYKVGDEFTVYGRELATAG